MLTITVTDVANTPKAELLKAAEFLLVQAGYVAGMPTAGALGADEKRAARPARS